MAFENPVRRRAAGGRWLGAVAVLVAACAPCNAFMPARFVGPGLGYSHGAVRGKKGDGIVMGGAGFGSRPKPRAVDPRVKQLLKQTTSVAMAQGMLFQEAVLELKKKDPLLFEQIIEAQQMGPGEAPPPDVHRALTEMTWDTMACFLPVFEGQEGKKGAALLPVMKKFEAIAAATKGSVLDVGCGDGPIVDFLVKQGCEEYLGIDLSGGMLQAAEAKNKKHKNCKFRKACFLTGELEEGAYDCVLFNGSLQFFPDTEELLRRAVACLKPRGRIVLSHANGAAFVEDEKRSNPMTVLSIMPSLAWLQERASDLGLRVQPVPAERDLDEFYLAVLEHAG